MATKTKKTARIVSARPDVAKNTSAPTSEIPAEVLSTGTEQSASLDTPHAVVDDTTRPQETSVSPAGEEARSVAKSLIVKSKVEGFRRAGRPWSCTAETVSIDTFSEEQIMALLIEPMLDVLVVSD